MRLAQLWAGRGWEPHWDGDWTGLAGARGQGGKGARVSSRASNCLNKVVVGALPQQARTQARFEVCRAGQAGSRAGVWV